MFDWLTAAVVGFVRHYGYVAVFVYMTLETAFILHFVPSEVVVPFAASLLVHDPTSFLLFDIDATAGATAGSILAYTVFGRYGRGVLERYGQVIHVTDRHIAWSDTVFTRYGESTVFWGRMLPLLRALVSIPAGLAEMDRWKFTLYSAAGAGVFNTALTYLVYSGAGTTSPLQVLIGIVTFETGEVVKYARVNTAFVVGVVGLFALATAVVWYARDWIRDHPTAAKAVTLHVVRGVGFLVGALFLAGALSAPKQAFAAITRVWNDPTVLVAFGFSDQIALLLTGLFVAAVGAAVYEVGTALTTAHFQAAADRIRR